MPAGQLATFRDEVFILSSSDFKGGPQKIPGIWLQLFGVTLFFLIINQYLLPDGFNVHDDTMYSAAQIMSRAMDEVKKYRSDLGIPINLTDDPNRTGLIGEYFTEITTTIGNLEAKRTTANPNFAALMVGLLSQAGVRDGDTIAIGASGSFPGLILATLAAVKAMNLKPIILASLGASMWGANQPRLTWLDMYFHLFQKGIFAYPINAASIGGDLDVGLELSPKGRQMISTTIKAYRVPFIYEKNLRVNVAKRLKIYDANRRGQKIKVFVNIGGAAVNTGVNPMLLDLKPGINYLQKYPPAAESGVLFEMGKRRIPVIHLLNIKGFSLKYGMPWDPVPLPAAGRGEIYGKIIHHHDKEKQVGLIILYFGAVGAIIVLNRKKVKL
jgi:poly-gamma-glutamate system protein